MTSRPLRVFLCHSSADKPAVRELYQKLRAEPWIQPWLDEEELYPGQDWEAEIEKAVEASDVVLVCLSNGSINKRGFVQKELRYALDIALEMPEETIFIVPLRLEECTPPRSLRDWQYADYFEGQRERGLQRLLVSLNRRADSIGALSVLNASTDTLSPDDKIKEINGPNFNFGDIRTDNPEVVERMFSRLTEYQKLVTDKRKNKTSKVYTLSNGMEFMRVPAGEFIMGSNYVNEKPQHTVDIPYGYWMSRYPVTNEQYSQFKKTNFDKAKSNHPVIDISWKNAVEYCIWLNRILNSEIKIENFQIRLPTEAEWEKAARCVDGRTFPWGNSFDENKCNTSEGGKNDTTSVGLYSPHGDSPFGCADMSGNVWEWTHSLYQPYPYNSKDGREDEKSLDIRVLRGGSTNYYERFAHCVSRFDNYSDGFYHFIGFRLVIAPALS